MTAMKFVPHELLVWAYSKLSALGLQNGSMDSALRMDEIGLILQGAYDPPLSAVEPAPDGLVDETCVVDRGDSYAVMSSDRKRLIAEYDRDFRIEAHGFSNGYNTAALTSRAPILSAAKNAEAELDLCLPVIENTIDAIRQHNASMLEKDYGNCSYDFFGCDLGTTLARMKRARSYIAAIRAAKGE